MSFFFFSSRRRHTRLTCDWSSDVCSSDLAGAGKTARVAARQATGGAGIRGIAAGKWRAGEAIEGLRGIAGRIQRPDYRRGHRGSAAGDVGQFSARHKLMSAVLDTHTELWELGKSVLARSWALTVGLRKPRLGKYGSASFSRAASESGAGRCREQERRRGICQAACGTLR